MPEGGGDGGSGWFRLLVALHPGEHRERFGDEMLRVHRARLREARRRGRVATAAFLVREGAGTLRSALVLRLRRGGAGARSNREGGGGGMDALGQDVRFALRGLARAPGFTAVAVVVLAVGIGAATAIFSAVNAVLIRPLPFSDPDRLVMLWEHNPEKGWWQETAAPANVLDWREGVEAFQDVAMYNPFTDGVTFIGEEGAEELQLTGVTGNFFDVLGVPVALGRDFEWEETWEGGYQPVILSHDLWVSRFGADSSVVGRTTDFAGVPAEVVGVMPAGFRFPDDATQMWAPYRWPRENREQAFFRRAHWVRPIARLAPGATSAEADAQLQAVVRELQERYPETNAVMGAGMTPLHPFLVGEVGPPLRILLAAVLLVLLVGCTNVGTLQLVRAHARGRELAVRKAMGAGGGRIVRLVLLEATLLALVGGVAGVALAWAGIAVLEGARPLTVAGLGDMVLDGRVALFAVALVLASGVLFGLVPALRATRSRPAEALREGGRTGSDGRRGVGAVQALVVTEVAVALVLVVGAGLLVRSFLELRSVDPGVRVDNVLVFDLTFPPSRYEERDAVLAAWRTALERFRALPDVEEAALSRGLPLTGSGWTSDFSMADWEPEEAGFEVYHREVTGEYFEVMDVPLLDGRAFTAADGPGDPPVVVVNQALVDRYFDGESPVGRRMAFDRVPSDESTWRTVVGVVGSERQEALSTPSRPEILAPALQDWSRTRRVVLRTRSDPRSVLPSVRQAVREMDPLVPVVSETTMADIVRSGMERERYILLLLTVFAGIALLLASVGLYGVLAQATRRRTREIGIRMALGAAPGAVRSMVLGQGMRLVVVGILVGLAAAAAGSRVMTGLLYEIRPLDPWTFATVPLALLAVALLASWLPARRATRVDPVDALRRE